MQKHRTIIWLTIVIYTAFVVLQLAAQDRSYSYDKAGNLKSIEVDTSHDPLNCGSIGNWCDNSKVCVGGNCVPPSCPPGASCGSPPNTQPSPVHLYCMTRHCATPFQPMLVEGGLRGHRVCGDFASDVVSFFFDCQPLATAVDTGWQLTPTFLLSADGKPFPNKAVVLMVTVPAGTELYIEFEGSGSSSTDSRISQEQGARQPGDDEVRDVGPNGQVAEVMKGNGVMTTWTLQFMMNTCRDVAQVNIFDVGSSGSTNGTMSPPLRVWLLRDPQESCN